MHRLWNFINLCIALIPISATLRDLTTQPSICLKSSPLISMISHVSIQTILSHYQYERFQKVIEEMENFCKQMTARERKVVQNYVNKCVVFYTAIILSFYVTASAFLLGPIFLHEPLPTRVYYPHHLEEREPYRTLIYVQHGYAAYCVASQLCINILVALLLWFTGARFEMLSEEWAAVSNANEFIESIKKHQDVLRYADNVIGTVRYSILNTVVFTVFSMLSAGLTIISRQPVVVKMQFIIVGMGAIAEVFTCCWPGNNLQVVSSDIGIAALKSPWYTYDTHVQNNLVHILLRCQKPATISISCFIPEVSFQFFSTYMSTAFSYFTTLRVILFDN